MIFERGEKREQTVTKFKVGLSSKKKTTLKKNKYRDQGEGGKTLGRR